MAASSSSAHDISAVLIPLKPSPASRRLPPPCWSHDETVALIDAYCDKWYSLRRGNLRASHWQEVADDVGSRCPVSSGSPKTSVQCRHKMEKLRKRYRSELQRSSATPSGHRFASSWVHFKRMDAMEKGPSAGPAADSSPVGRDPDDEDNEEEEEEDDDEALYQSVKRGSSHNPSPYGSMSNGIGGGSAFRIKIPGRPSVALPPPAMSMYGKFDGKSYPSVDASPNFVATRVVKDEYSDRSGLGKRGGGGGGDRVGKKREGDPVGEMVAAIKSLGDGFVRMEKMKMEMAREVEAMRMDMEMKRTEMILESQQRIVEAFAKAFSEKRSKKPKRMPTPES